MTKTSGSTVGHDLDRKKAPNANYDEETGDSGPHNVLGGDEKTADKLENADGGDGEKGRNRTADTDISEQRTDIKSMNAGGSDEERHGKPDNAEAGNDNADDENGGSTQEKTSRIRTVVNRVRLLINCLFVTY